MAEAEDHKESLQQEANPQFADAKEEPVSISENQNESQQQESNPHLTDAKEESISTSESLQRETSLQFTDAKEEAVSISEENEATGLEKQSEEQSNEAADRIKELESQLHGMKVELEGLASKKSELELQVESQETEARGLRDENSKLSTRVLELEEMAEKSRLEAAEFDLQQELVSIQVQNSYLEQSMECIRNEASNQVKDLTDRVNVMQQELGNTQNTVSQKVPENLFETGTPKVTVAKRVLVEKEELEVKVSGLEVGADTSLTQRNELEQQVKSKVHETIQLKDEKQELHARIFELEGIVTEREKDLFDLQNKYESEEKTEAPQIKNKTSDQPRNSKGPDESTSSQPARNMISANISKFNKFSDQAKTNDKIPSSRSMLNINIAKTNKNAKESVETPRKMKGDQSMRRRMDELATEFRCNIEDKVRLLSQRIRVLEQLNAENNSTHKLLQQENKLLLEKVAHNETQFKKLKDLDKIAKTTMKGLEFMASKLDVGNKDLDRLTTMFNELQLAKNWIQKRYESIVQLGYTLDSLNAEIGEKKEKIQNLEAKVEEREEEVVHLGEKKREVIRQLCVMTDHLREENEHLKDMVSKLNAKKRQLKR